MTEQYQYPEYYDLIAFVLLVMHEEPNGDCNCYVYERGMYLKCILEQLLGESFEGSNTYFFYDVVKILQGYIGHARRTGHDI